MGGPDGGFVVKIDGKEAFRCVTVSFDYEEWQMIVNNTEKKKIPRGAETISVTIEREGD